MPNGQRRVRPAVCRRADHVSQGIPLRHKNSGRGAAARERPPIVGLRRSPVVVDIVLAAVCCAHPKLFGSEM